MSTTIFYVVGGLAFLYALGIRRYVKSVVRRWSRVPSASRLFGATVARRILDAHQLQAVSVRPAHGSLTDRYDPRRGELYLARDTFTGESVSAVAMAAVGCGRALQADEDEWLTRLRNAMGPIARAAARFGLPVTLVGYILALPALIQIGVLGYAASLMFTLLILPAAFRTSRHALLELDRLELISTAGRAGAREVLQAVALTQVADVASSAWYLLSLLLAGGRSLLRRPEPQLPPAN